MNNYFKKRIATLFILLVMMPVMAVAPRRAHAILGVGDISFDPTVFSEFVLSYSADVVKYAEDGVRWIEENWQKVMRDVIAKRIIDYTVDETVKWVQGGGDPKFVTDWNGFMKDAGAMAFDSVIKEAGLTNICEPFKVQLNVALIPEEKLKRERVECSISDIVANVEDFYDNFENGGWLAYGASIKPENNLYMQLVMFDDEVKTKTNFSEDIKKQKASSGQGFLSVSKCIADDSQELYDYCVSNNYFDTGDPNYCYTYADENKTCTQEDVQTPGNMVGKALGESITSDSAWAANIQSWTSALVNAAINRLTQEGVAAMTGSKPSAGPAYDPASSEYGDIKAADIIEQQKDRIAQIEIVTISYQKLVTEKEKAKTYTEQILDLFSQIKLLDVNRICVPQVTNSEIANQQAILDRLIAELAPIKPVVVEGSEITTKLKTLSNSIRDVGIARTLVDDFVAKYTSEDIAKVQEAFQGSDDSAKQFDTLQDTQSRFSQCKQKIDLLNAGTTPTQ